VYLTQAIIADDVYMRLRVSSCAAQEGCADVGINPDEWASEWRRVWAAAPGWDLAWESAQAGGVEDPGKDPGVVTDSMILSQVQTMKPFKMIERPELPDIPEPEPQG
jgi:hypothetical protein